MAERSDPARGHLGKDIEHRRARAAVWIAPASYDEPPDAHIVTVVTEYLGERKVWGPGLILAVARAWIGGTTEVLVLEEWSGRDYPMAIPLSRVVGIYPAPKEDPPP